MHRSLIRRSVVIVLAIAVFLGSGVTDASATPINGANRFSQAPLLPAGEGRYTGNNLTATKQAGEPNHAGNAGGASVWYRLRLNHRPASCASRPAAATSTPSSPSTGARTSATSRWSGRTTM